METVVNEENMGKGIIALSVVIPVYNAEEHLKKCLDSVLQQSLRNIEVICVDDGSTDSSPQILKEYADTDERVRVIRQENQHAGIARNTGLEAARGEYIHFLDADDHVLDYAYEALYNKVVKYNLDALCCPALTWDVQRETFVEDHRSSLSGLRTGDYNRLLTMDENSPLYKVSVAPWSWLYRRSFLMEKDTRFNNLYCVNDRSFFWAVMTNAGRVMAARDRLVFHNVSQSGSLIGKKEEHFDCSFRSIEITEERLARDEIDMQIRKRVLRAEFKNLFDLYRKYFSGTEEEDSARLEAERFVEEYRGAYSYLLKEYYRDTLKKISTYNPDWQPEEMSGVFHEECAAPKVSVVVPTYNVEDYLNEALHSLSAQKLEEMEFLLVNDGSTDGSLAIMKEYAALDKRMRILDGPNGGYGRAMNRGIDAARGEYLGILEPDDFVPSDMFAELYETAEQNQADFVKADFFRFKVNSDGSLNSRRGNLTSDGTFYGRVLCPMEEPETFRFVMNTWSGIYSLAFLRKWNIRHNETPGASYQDNGFWFQTICRAERVYFLQKPFYMNRRDNPNSSVYSTGKMYCMTEEYRFIQNWLEQDTALKEKVIRFLYRRKFGNFMFTYRRLAPGLQREYLHHIYDEFKGPYEGGLVDTSIMGEAEAMQLKEILEDPDAYYEHLCVSVIMPVYNAERYLRQALDSLLVRNEIQFEVICVDDGSTDSSLAILREYEAADPRVRVITQPNAGAGAARNHGMRLARGEYLSFLDSDDFFEPEMLRFAYDRAHLYDADIVAFRCNRYHEKEGKYSAMNFTIKRDLLPAEEPFSGKDIELNVLQAFSGYPWDKLFKTEFIRRNGFTFLEQPCINDQLFVFSAILNADKICTMNNILVHYRRPDGALTYARNQENKWRCFYDSLCRLREDMSKWGIFEGREQDFINYALSFSVWNLTSLSGQAYYALYAKLKEEWFSDLGITAHGEDYFYNYGEYEQLQLILRLSPEEFLHQRVAGLEERSSRLGGVESRLRRANADKSRINARLQQTYAEKSEINRKLQQTYAEKSEINRKLQQTYAEKSEINRKLKTTYQEKAERGLEIKRLNAELAAKDKDLKAANAQKETLRKELSEEKAAHEKERKASEKRNQKLKLEKAQLTKQRDQLDKKLTDIRSSRSYRLGRALTAPARKVKKLLRG